MPSAACWISAALVAVTVFERSASRTASAVDERKKRTVLNGSARMSAAIVITSVAKLMAAAISRSAKPGERRPYRSEWQAPFEYRGEVARYGSSRLLHAS